MKNTPVTFSSVKKMKISQLNKLTKEQLVGAMKEAVESANSDDRDSIDSSKRNKYSPGNVLTVNDAVAAAVREMKDEMVSMFREMLDNLKMLIMSEINNLRGKVTSMKEEIHSEISEELKDQERRRNNIMIFGLQEDPIESSNDETRAVVEPIFKTINVEDVAIDSCFRVGSRRAGRRPIKVILRNEDMKQKVLRNCRKLGSLPKDHALRKVFLKPDLTSQQLVEERRVRDEFLSRRNGGEKVFTRNGKVVPRRSFQSFLVGLQQTSG